MKPPKARKVKKTKKAKLGTFKLGTFKAWVPKPLRLTRFQLNVLKRMYYKHEAIVEIVVATTNYRTLGDKILAKRRYFFATDPMKPIRYATFWWLFKFNLISSDGKKRVNKPYQNVFFAITKRGCEYVEKHQS